MKRRFGVTALGVAALLGSLLGGGAGAANAAQIHTLAGVTASAQSAEDSNSPPARSGKWLVDAQGRVIVEHGWNIAQKTEPYYPDFLTAEDARFLANQGFTTARISFNWKGAEPAPGHYDDDYLRNVLDVNTMLAKYGISVLYDFHHNGWNVRGGAPDWATLGTDTGSSFQAFWEDRPAADGVGIQTRFIDLWKHIAKLVNDDPNRGNIVGFNPFNEPSPGTDTGCPAFGGACPEWEESQLADFYVKMIDAVRSTGSPQVIWPEGPPSSGVPHSLPVFEDPQVGYNFHFYCTVGFSAGWAGRNLTPEEQVECERQKNEQLIDGFLASAEERNEPAFMSEFGCGDDPIDNARVVDAAGRAFASWANWEYHLDGNATGPCPGLLIDPAAGATMSNVKIPRLEATSVPYPHEIAGTPESYDFNRDTNTMTLTYGTVSVTGVDFGEAAPTRIFVPQLHYGTGYVAEVTGGRVVSQATAAWVEVVAENDADSVTVTIKPTTGSHTDLPCPDQGEGIPVEATVPEDAPGSLALSIADFGDGVVLSAADNAGDRLRFEGQLPAVTVTDSRNGSQAGAGGWAVAGQSSTFTGGGIDLGAEHLGWTPQVLTPRPGVVAGPRVDTTIDGGPGLSAPATLARANSAGRMGSADLTAGLFLEVPVDTPPGTYIGTVTVSLFPID